MIFDKVNRYSIFKDTIMGAGIFFIISTLNEMYNESNDLVRIFAFTWAVPVLYFFFINMFLRRGKNAIIDFNKHALLGLFLSIIAILFTSCCLDTCSLQTIVYGNLIFLICSIFLYLKMGIYKKGVL